MYSKTVAMINSENMYQVAELVQLACRYHSHISIKNDHCEFNAKSIMGMMSLDPHDGKLIVSAEGADETEAVNALVLYLESSK